MRVVAWLVATVGIVYGYTLDRAKCNPHVPPTAIEANNTSNILRSNQGDTIRKCLVNCLSDMTPFNMGWLIMRAWYC